MDVSHLLYQHVTKWLPVYGTETVAEHLDLSPVKVYAMLMRYCSDNGIVPPRALTGAMDDEPRLSSSKNWRSKKKRATAEHRLVVSQVALEAARIGHDDSEPDKIRKQFIQMVDPVRQMLIITFDDGNEYSSIDDFLKARVVDDWDGERFNVSHDPQYDEFKQESYNLRVLLMEKGSGRRIPSNPEDN